MAAISAFLRNAERVSKGAETLAAEIRQFLRLYRRRAERYPVSRTGNDGEGLSLASGR